MISRSDNTTADFKDQVDPDRRAFLGMVRRMIVKVTGSATWQLAGVLLDDNSRETIQAPAYSGVGFYARPAPGVNAEAAVVFDGAAAENPMVVAARDEETRRKVAAIDQDETAAFNTKSIVLIKKDGTIEIRLAGGTALKLPTLADYEALRTFVNAQFSGAGHTHATPSGITTATTAIGSPPGSPAGTQVLKAQ